MLEIGKMITHKSRLVAKSEQTEWLFEFQGPLTINGQLRTEADKGNLTV